MAKSIGDTINSIPYFLKLKYSLLKSRWFGSYGANLVYMKNAKNKIFVKRWVELHGDSLNYKIDSDDVGIYVTMQGVPGSKEVDTEPGLLGKVHVYKNQEVHYDQDGKPYIVEYPQGAERDAIIIMRYDPQAADFLDFRKSGGITGTGLRSVLFPSWYQYAEVLGNLMDYLERVGTGVVLWKYIAGDENSYNRALQMAESMSNQAVLMVPVELNSGGKPVEGLELINASAIGMENMMAVVKDIFEQQIRRMIVGQDATSQNISTGLGSKLAEVHQNTFSRIVQFDCCDLEQTLTDQLVRVIQKWNFPGTEDTPCRYVVDYASSNIEGKIEAAKTLYEMGISFDGDELRSLVGLKKPTENSVIIKKSPDQPTIPGLNTENPFSPDGEVSEETDVPMEEEKVTEDIEQD